METGRLFLERALMLKPQDRFMLIEGLIESPDEPDKSIDRIWAEEAEKRLKAHRAGKLKGVPYKEIFGEDIEKFRFLTKQQGFNKC